MNSQITFILMFLVNSVFLNCTVFGSDDSEIRLQNLKMQLEDGNQFFIEDLLLGEIAETEVNHVILAGPYKQSEMITKEYDTILIFFKGEGKLISSDQTFNIKPESIALPLTSEKILIDVSKSDTLHYLKINKKHSKQDLLDLQKFPEDNRSKTYFKNFDECKAYTEKIKSPNTVSRTVLPKDHIPRVAMGTVETIGPDAVGAHEHPMLDQLFFGLEGNDVIVHADDNQVEFKEFSLLHIPIGSSHWVAVEKGKNMYYQWMDFFLTKKGEEWLKTHKHIDDDKKGQKDY
jgi:mannose-6-phosphate isomerase-like protein (cupin superfamily)